MWETKGRVRQILRVRRIIKLGFGAHWCRSAPPFLLPRGDVQTMGSLEHFLTGIIAQLTKVRLFCMSFQRNTTKTQLNPTLRGTAAQKVKSADIFFPQIGNRQKID